MSADLAGQEHNNIIEIYRFIFFPHHFNSGDMEIVATAGQLSGECQHFFYLLS